MRKESAGLRHTRHEHPSEVNGADHLRSASVRPDRYARLVASVEAKVVVAFDRDLNCLATAGSDVEWVARRPSRPGPRRLVEVLPPTIWKAAEPLCMGSLSGMAVEPEDFRYEGKLLRMRSSILEVADGQVNTGLLAIHEIAPPRSHQTLEQHTLELSALNEVAQTVATVTDLPDTLRSVAAMVTRLLGAQAAFIGVLNSSRVDLAIYARFGEDSSLDAEGEAAFRTPHLPGVLQALDTGRSVVLDRPMTLRWPPEIHSGLSSAGIVTLLVVPMRVRRESIGVIAVGMDRADSAFAEWQIRLVETVAAQVAGAIKTSRLQGAEQRQRQKAESLEELASSLAVDLDLTTVMDLILVEVGRVVHNVGAGLYLREGDELVLSDAAGLQKRTVGRRISVAGSHPVAQVYRSGRAFVLADTAMAPVWADAEEPYRYRCWVGAPLASGGAILGVLAVVDLAPRSYMAEDARTLQTFGNHAATAIANAQYVQQARQLAVVEERQRLARELHDSVTQLLYSMTLMTRGWQAMAEAGHPPEARDTFERLHFVAQQTLREARLMVFQLRPTELDEMGLVGALRSRLDIVEKRAGIDARLQEVGRLSIPRDTEEQLYYIAIEALNNSLRHAGATAVEVRILADDSSWTLEVIDNGKGFDTAAASKGLGLANIMERARMIHAHGSIESTPEEGTRIVVVSRPEGDPEGRPKGKRHS